MIWLKGEFQCSKEDLLEDFVLQLGITNMAIAAHQVPIKWTVASTCI
jgi:hypothetical protein